MITVAELNAHIEQITELHAHCYALFQEFKRLTGLNFEMVEDETALQLPVEGDALVWSEAQQGCWASMAIPVDVAYGTRTVAQWAAEYLVAAEVKRLARIKTEAERQERTERETLARLLDRYGAPS